MEPITARLDAQIDFTAGRSSNSFVSLCLKPSESNMNKAEIVDMKLSIAVAGTVNICQMSPS